MAMALFLSATFARFGLAQSTAPGSLFIERTNINHVKQVTVHYYSLPNRSIALQGIIALNCTNGHCNANGVNTNGWATLRGPLPASPLSEHFIYSEVSTNQSHFYRLQFSP